MNIELKLKHVIVGGALGYCAYKLGKSVIRYETLSDVTRLLKRMHDNGNIKLFDDDGVELSDDFYDTIIFKYVDR